MLDTILSRIFTSQWFVFVIVSVLLLGFTLAWRWGVTRRAVIWCCRRRPPSARLTCARRSCRRPTRSPLRICYGAGVDRTKISAAQATAQIQRERWTRAVAASKEAPTPLVTTVVNALLVFCSKSCQELVFSEGCFANVDTRCRRHYAGDPRFLRRLSGRRDVRHDGKYMRGGERHHRADEATSQSHLQGGYYEDPRYNHTRVDVRSSSHCGGRP